MKEIRYIPNVASLQLDPNACIGCGLCATVCPHGVVAMNHRKARIVDLDGCMECGACANNCPTQAVQCRPGVGCASYIIKGWVRGTWLDKYLSNNCC